MRRDPEDLPRVLLTARAGAHGYTREAVRHRLAVGRWHRMVRGVLLTRDDAPTREDWITAGLLIAGPRAALSGWDAVREIGLGERTPPSDVALVLDRSGANRTLPGVHIRPTARPYTARPLPALHPTLPFVPVVAPARAVADTALQYGTFRPVRALVTSAIQQQRCTPRDLADELARGPRQHSGWLRTALADVLVNAKSVAEAEAIDLLARAKVPSFEVNVPIVDLRGTVLAEADILFRGLRWIVEVDGREFHFGEDDWLATDDRHTFLTRNGLAIEHHAPSRIRGGGAHWAAGVALGLRARAAELGVPWLPGNGPLPTPSGGHPPVVLPIVATHNVINRGLRGSGPR